jgi:hypothetical protein
MSYLDVLPQIQNTTSFIAFVFYALSLIFPYPSLYNVLVSVSFLDAFALPEGATILSLSLARQVF